MQVSSRPLTALMKHGTNTKLVHLSSQLIFPEMFCISPYKLAINGIECYLALNLFLAEIAGILRSLTNQRNTSPPGPRDLRQKSVFPNIVKMRCSYFQSLVGVLLFYKRWPIMLHCHSGFFCNGRVVLFGICPPPSLVLADFFYFRPYYPKAIIRAISH